MQKDRKSLYKYLKNYHTGSENAVVCKQLQLRFKLSEGTIRGYVAKLRKDGIPICSSCFGYFYPESRLDVVDNVTRFNKYIFSLSATSARLLSATVKK